MGGRRCGYPVSLREGSDVMDSIRPFSMWQFQSTLPRREQTQENRRGNPPAAISIHAPVPRGISPCMNCSVPNMPAKKTTLNYSKLLKISVKSHRFYWLDLYKTGKTARKQNSYNSEVDTGDWLCYSITNKSSRESEGSEQNVHRKRTNVGSNVYEHAVLCSDAA